MFKRLHVFEVSWNVGCVGVNSNKNFIGSSETIFVRREKLSSHKDK